MTGRHVRQVLNRPLALAYAEHTAAAILGGGAQVRATRDAGRDVLTISVRGCLSPPMPAGKPEPDGATVTTPPREAVASITLSADLLTADRITRACHMVAQMAGRGADR